MTMPSLPAQGSTSWMPWATGVQDAASQVKDGRLTDTSLRAAYERRPAPLDGTHVYGYGDSFLAELGNFPAEQGIIPVVANRVGAAGYTNGALAGSTLAHALAMLVDGAAIWTPGTRGLVLIKAVINSVINLAAADDIQEKIGIAEALRAMICMIRAATWVNEDVTANQVLSIGQWSASSPPTVRGGSIVKSVVEGATVTITTTAHEIDLMLLTFPGTTAGSPFSVTVNGDYHGSGTTVGQAAPSASNGYHHMTYRVTGLTGTSTVVLTHGAGTGELFYDGYLEASPTPPGVVVCLDSVPAAAGLEINGAGTNRTAANLEAYNAIIAQGCSEFDDLVRVADPRPRFNNANGRATDLLHPSAIGAANYADAIYSQAVLLPASAGLLP